MGVRKPFNDYEIRGETTVIFLENKKGERYETLIDTEELQKIINMDLHWHLRYNPDTKSYYAKATGRVGMKKSIYLHIEIMNTDVKKKEYVDHINHDTLDNRKENLRVTNNIQNNQNKNGKHKNNKSGYRNVCWNKWDNCWQVQLQIEGKNKVLKRFKKDQLEEAGKYAEDVRLKYYGEFAGKSQ